jgi:transposase InsO family protein
MACGNGSRVSAVAEGGAESASEEAKTAAPGNYDERCHRRRAEHRDDVWCWDFVFDRTATGSALKWLSIVDEHTRECLALKVSRSIASEDLIDTLAELLAMRGVPRFIRSDNGPEFVATNVRRWLEHVAWGRCTSSLAVLGRMVTPRAFTADCEMSFWHWRCLRTCRQRGS